MRNCKNSKLHEELINEFQDNISEYIEILYENAYRKHRKIADYFEISLAIHTALRRESHFRYISSVSDVENRNEINKFIKILEEDNNILVEFLKRSASKTIYEDETEQYEKGLLNE